MKQWQLHEAKAVTGNRRACHRAVDQLGRLPVPLPQYGLQAEGRPVLRKSGETQERRARDPQDRNKKTGRDPFLQRERPPCGFFQSFLRTQWEGVRGHGDDLHNRMRSVWVRVRPRFIGFASGRR